MASDDSEQNPYTRPGFVAAAIVVALVVILAAVLGYKAVAEPDDPDPTTAPTSFAPTATAAPTDSPSVQGGESVCGLEPVELDGTLNAAPDTEWELVGTSAAPSVENHGPGEVEEDGFRYCYSQTPTGALLAAANTATIGSDPELAVKSVQLLADGAGKEVAAEQAEAALAGGSTGGTVQVAGFRFLNYTGTSAKVDLAFRLSTGELVSQPFDLVWEAGDWKLRTADDGQLLSGISQIPDLTGYVLWAGA
ncbi:hypothetical protein [Georgenia daeguensis]|uniref:DUF8175 domain-containing protein n=1 Tax=Georgenia daeguensis TaxID=908355 RepID=A0ABP6USI8_9MICO